MLKVGLTGGIGSGKTAVANMFAELGVPVIDADVIAREVVEPGQPAYQAVVDYFGEKILKPDNTLDRARLREIIFSDSRQRVKLESILHPEIRARIKQKIAEAKGPYCLIVIPLMIETGQTDLVDQLVVVDVPVEQQVARTCERDGVSPEQVESIIRSQVDRVTRRSVADFIIENTGSLDDLRTKVRQLHEYFLQIKNTLVEDMPLEHNIPSSKNNKSHKKLKTQVIPQMSMLNTAQCIDEETSSILANSENIVYEFPCNEKIRTYIRLESMFDEIEFKLQGTTVRDTRSTISSFIALLNVFSRPEIKTDLMKEMDRINTVLSKYSSTDGVNTDRLNDVQNELCQTVKLLKAFEGQIGQSLKLNELVNAIRQRDSLPGGALEIDIPNYAYWLAQDIDMRNADIRAWMKEFDLIKNAIKLVLQLIRSSAVSEDVVAKKGFYQHVLETGIMMQIVRVMLPKDSLCFPEISGARHRFSIRFLKHMGANRPVQVDKDISFRIVSCAL